MSFGHFQMSDLPHDEQVVPTEPQSAETPEIDSRVTIHVTTDEHLVNDQAADALGGVDNLYVRGHQLVRIIPGTPINGRPTAPLISPVGPELREMLCQQIKFIAKERRTGESYSIHPPHWCVDGVANRKHWPKVKPLTGLVTCPVMRSDGSILCKPGYDPQSQLYLSYSDQPIALPHVLTQQDAMDAANMLLDLVHDFPFASDADKASFLACALTPFARPAFSGPVPMFVIDANMAGTGKSMLADIAGTLASGEAIPRMVLPRGDDEMRKQITSIVIRGDSITLIDNVATTVNYPSLDAALTSTTWKDRLLGSSKAISLPITTVWIMTGNNVAVAGDTIRRVCRCRLESYVENPQDRETFKIPFLMQHLNNNLPKYQKAILTILGAYDSAGRPPMPMRPWGSFEGWSNLVRGAVIFAGLPDPADTIDDLREDSTGSNLPIRELIRLWTKFDQSGRGITAAQMLVNAQSDSELRDVLCELCGHSPEKLPTAGSLGSKLARFKGCVVGQQRLESRKVSGTQFWSILNLRS